ncbi:MAG TPA: CehA/McbA family metallohydrolase [Candidatus Acidoferrum sp.]|nr:CehA/McbA family metallohydrolase [Candidatus Acidoferrum sp.]
MPSTKRRADILWLLVTNAAFISRAFGAEQAKLELAKDVELQPLVAQVRRLAEALDYLGAPLTPVEKTRLKEASDRGDPAEGVALIQAVLDPHCLVGVSINPEMRVKATAGPAEPALVEKGWTTFLVKVLNQAGATAELRVVSPNALAAYEADPPRGASDKFYKTEGAKLERKAGELWLDLDVFRQQPMKRNLSGLPLEYAVMQLYSRDAGQREAKLSFDVGQGTQDLGYRNDVDILFRAGRSTDVTFQIKDENGKPAMASFVIRDRQGHVYPARSKRLAPDFGFQEQIYRMDGERVTLPAGEYEIQYARGPEYLTGSRTIKVGPSPERAEFQLQRWIDPSKLGWWSGDHHIHAAGCAHYVKPTEGVLPVDMFRHCLGEDLKVGANLTWGPCFDYQKQFFTGKIDAASRYPYLLRYDVEVSGFGSHESGHLCLLRLKDQIYPGGDSDKHWPTLCLNTHRWAKRQGAVTGSAHSGWGLEVDTQQLPNYVVPPFNGIGANEYIVDVTHSLPGPGGKLMPAVDFISTVDTPYVWELNIWYHTLNVGFRTRISGETDFPCIYGERVGLGRSYVKLDGELDYDRWCEGIRQGRNYASDGRSHLLDFRANGVAMGENGSELKLPQLGNVRVTATVAALLNEQPNPVLQHRRYDQKPYWNIERARIGSSREVPLELVVNGYPVAQKAIQADGNLREVAFEVKVDRSSWIALRILPSSHTNPIFVLVEDRPIRASRRSAEWCLKGVEQCWSQKQRFIKTDEIEDAKQAYEHARQAYQRLTAECVAD